MIMDRLPPLDTWIHVHYLRDNKFPARNFSVMVKFLQLRSFSRNPLMSSLLDVCEM
jgi:hypothetical protein